MHTPSYQTIVNNYKFNEHCFKFLGDKGYKELKAVLTRTQLVNDIAKGTFHIKCNQEKVKSGVNVMDFLQNFLLFSAGSVKKLGEIIF